MNNTRKSYQKFNTVYFSVHKNTVNKSFPNAARNQFNKNRKR